ncbi:MAG: hypothetical protein R3B47_17115 [Bacteroidia bacterium]
MIRHSSIARVDLIENGLHKDDATSVYGCLVDFQEKSVRLAPVFE